MPSISTVILPSKEKGYRSVKLAPFISVIILAAGESKRMGKLKQLLPLGQNTILEQTIDNFLNSKINEVIVVVGYIAEEVIKLIAARQVKVALNPDYCLGMSTSLLAGLKVINNEAQGIMLALADQPFIASQTIDYLIEAFAHHEKIIVPSHQGRRGHPVIFPRKYKKELASLKGDVGGREVLARYPEDVLEVAVDCDSIIEDIDTMDIYIRKTGRINPK